MKKLLLYITCIVLCLIGAKLKAQETFPAEKVIMWTDRALFVCGEQIQFAGEVHIQEEQEIFSQVVYIELITPNNQKINQIKLPIHQSYFEGRISIPIDILSGYYYLRAYTKWMRNGNPEDYEYHLIKIINPYHSQVVSEQDTSIIVPEKLEIETYDIPSYQEGDSIILPPDFYKMQLDHKSIAIIPDETAAFQTNKSSKTKPFYDQIQYYPETRGLSISGKILLNDQYSAYHKMNVHVLGKKDFIDVLCDSFGNFNVALPQAYQDQELFLIAAMNHQGKVSIQIDQDFCTKEMLLPSPAFKLEEGEEEIFLKMAKNQQIKQTFFKEENSKLIKDTILPFYGAVFKTIKIDFYVPLDSLEQYFTDIPSWVVVKKKKKKRYLQLLGSQADLTLYPALVLVDWVPVDDAERVLAMNPSLIEKIDIINQSYIHGNEIYGGIIHIQTYKGDFGDLKFPESGQYLNYKFYSTHSNGSSIPYTFNNTPLWKTQVPNVQDLHIQTPPLPGKYLIILQGINQQGKLKRLIQKIQVK